MKKNLVLLGMMAVGKTTLGKMVAKKQKLEFIDVDKNIEKKNFMSIKDIFKKKGEAFFRKEEEKETIKCLKNKNCIIALGGGAFINKKIREVVLKKTFSIWLDIDIETLIARSKYNQNRPLAMKGNSENIKSIYEERKKTYKLAHQKIMCDKLNKSEIVEKIIDLYELQ